jgi:hypothetical protein
MNCEKQFGRKEAIRRHGATRTIPLEPRKSENNSNADGTFKKASSSRYGFQAVIMSGFAIKR